MLRQASLGRSKLGFVSFAARGLVAPAGIGSRTSAGDMIVIGTAGPGCRRGHGGVAFVHGAPVAEDIFFRRKVATEHRVAGLVSEHIARVGVAGGAFGVIILPLVSMALRGILTNTAMVHRGVGIHR